MQVLLMGTTATAFTLIDVMKVARLVKQLHPHASVVPGELRRNRRAGLSVVAMKPADRLRSAASQRQEQD